MSIVAAELIAYGSASRPSDDVSAAGGAIDLTDRPTFTQLTANAVIAAVSDGADTRTLTVQGRNAAGDVVTDVITLTGAVEAVGGVTFERILTLTLSAGSASRTVTVKQGAGGATRATLAINQVSATAFFRQSSSAASQKIRYEKFFWKNTNATLSLTTAQVMLTADPDARIRIGAAPSKGDSASVATRLTAPSSVTFVDDSVAISVPTGSLAAGEALGVWVEQDLPATDPAHKSTFTTQLSGNSV